MKKLYIARHMTEAHLLRGFLESQGIASIVRGDLLTGGFGELPVDQCSVWLTDERQFARADELVRDFLKGSFARIYSGERWVCPQCNETLEGQFTQCWRCGSAKA